MTVSSLPDFLLKPVIEHALHEDLGRAGDITTAALISVDKIWKAELKARTTGTIAGMDVARLAFQLVDKDVRWKSLKSDGDSVGAGDCLAIIEGRARSLLSAERVALNFLCHLSGVATQTAQLVAAVTPYHARVCCTRKTTPGLRALEKHAVLAGGGFNHRFGLDDAVLIKDNHIAVAGGIREALQAARKKLGHLVKIEIEVDTLDQLDELLALLPEFPFDVVMLDNMDCAQLSQAVAKVQGRVLCEASGGVTRSTIAAIAATGVDLISAGWITHSAPILDIGLDVAGA